MAAVSSAADQATGLLKKLSLDSQSKTEDVPDIAKKPPAINYGAVDGGEVSNTPISSCERSVTPLLQDFIDPSMCYLHNGYSPAYCYGAYDAPLNEWEDYSRYMNTDGVEMPPTGVYGNMYHPGYGYAPYGAYPPGSPVPTMGHDGQLYGPQQYQYPGPYYQQPTPASSPFTPNQVPISQGEVSTSVGSEHPSLPSDSAKGNSNGTANGDTNRKAGSTAPLRPSNNNSSVTSNGSYVNGVFQSSLSSSYQDPRYGFDGMRSPVPWLDGSAFLDGQHRLPVNSSAFSAVSRVGNISSARNQNRHPLPHLMGFNPARPSSGMAPAAPGFMNGMYSDNRMYFQCGNAYKTGLGFKSNGYDSRTNGRGWLAVDSKFKPRGRGNGLYDYGNESLEGLNELNRGPRSGRFKNQKGLVHNVTIAVKGQALSSNGDNEDSSVVPDRDQYNQADFCEKHSDAKFFVIKSYSEDDIHKSIKYGVWASTPNGNKKLDAGYQDAQEKAGGCPIFLFFSVNTSGQFVGVAEMVGPVDFNKTMDYWQQDKWNGCFPVKWHIVKDVPNSMLKHITLENNENKPVTNSRDTQEVKLEPGLKMLKLFEDHVSKTSILDDFGFYETRQKIMQEKRAKQRQFQKQVWDGKPAGDATEEKVIDETIGKMRLQKPPELASVVNKEVARGGPGESELSEENGLTAKAGEAPKVAKPVTERQHVVVPNGCANGC